MAAEPCYVVADSDIAGVGVRTSIYTQTLLSFAPPLIFVLDGVIDLEEEKLLRTIYGGLLLTSCSILTSAFIQARTIGLSAYHALMVLNLCWMMNASALILCIYPTIHGWRSRRRWYSILSPTKLSHLATAFFITLQLSAMGCLGIWVWAERGIFGRHPIFRGRSDSGKPCFPDTNATFFGQDIPMSSESLRTASLFVYAVAAVPIINVVVFTGVTLALSVILLHCYKFMIKPKRRDIAKGRSAHVVAVLIQFLVSVRLLVDTELMVHQTFRRRPDVESSWSFGQTLAMLLIISPFYEFAKHMVGEKGKWRFRSLLSRDQRDWNTWRYDMAEKVEKARDLISQQQKFIPNAEETRQASTAYVEAMKLALESANTALDTAKNSIDATNVIVQAQGSDRTVASGADVETAWRQNQLAAVRCISLAREDVIAVRSGRCREVKDEFCFTTGRANLATAERSLEAARAALRAVDVVYPHDSSYAGLANHHITHTPTRQWSSGTSYPGNGTGTRTIARQTEDEEKQTEGTTNRDEQRR